MEGVLIVGSHPTRVRGLKRCPVRGRWHGRGASHPTRVRGLKPFAHLQLMAWLTSHPTRVRGLKQLAILKTHNRPAGRTPRGCVD